MRRARLSGALKWRLLKAGQPTEADHSARKLSQHHLQWRSAAPFPRPHGTAPIPDLPRAGTSPFLDFASFPSALPRARIGIVSRITARDLPLGDRYVSPRPNGYVCGVGEALAC